MQFQPTTLILSASAQREHFDSVRLDTAGADIARWEFDRFDRVKSDRSAARVATPDHRVRRSVAALLVRVAGAIEPRPVHRAAARG